MHMVSDAWVRKNADYLAPEGFVELSLYIPQAKQTLTYTKSDLMSFFHEQTGSLVSGELPKNHIEFSLDNSDDKWNPSYPKGLARYLSERLKITLRYGMDIDGVTEWIPGGVFYLSEWHTPNNGLEASFVARDLLEFMMDTPYTGTITGTLFEVASRAIAAARLPSDAVVILAEDLKNYTIGAIEYRGDESVAEILQKCANAACCVMYQNRDGALVIERLNTTDSGYTVTSVLSYSFPEIELSRPLRNVSVSYLNDEKVSFTYATSGETQTLTNEFISTEEQASEVARWVCDMIRTRKQISGEFRGDPRLDVFDVIRVESKYGMITDVVLTDIKYNFTGAFHAEYSGHIMGSGTPVVMYSGEIYAGEVI